MQIQLVAAAALWSASACELFEREQDPALAGESQQTPSQPSDGPADPSSSAQATDPPSSGSIEAKDHSETAAHIAEGQRLGRLGDHRAALAAFERALQNDPNNAAALCEAGLQALRLGELAQAETLLTGGAQRSVVATRKGACLYNLGRVYEEEGERDKAILQYTTSLQLRDNDTVRERLTQLNAAAQFDLQAHAPTLPALCQKLERPADKRIECVEERSRVSFPDAGVGAELVFLRDDHERWPQTTHRLVLKTKTGYRDLGPLGWSETHSADTADSHLSIEAVSLEQLLPGGPREVRVRLKSEQSYADEELDETIEQTAACAHVGSGWCCHIFDGDLPRGDGLRFKVCEPQEGL